LRGDRFPAAAAAAGWPAGGPSKAKSALSFTNDGDCGMGTSTGGARSASRECAKPVTISTATAPDPAPASEITSASSLSLSISRSIACRSRAVLRPACHRPNSSTLRMGQMLESVRSPKPSRLRAAMLRPEPRLSTSGTVTGPVVTPALSQPMLVNSSVL